MHQQSIALRYVTRDDVARLKSWLEDDEVAESWFGRYSYGNPAHLGYNPTETADAREEEWSAIFEDPTHHILSIYTEDGRAHRRVPRGYRGDVGRRADIDPDRPERHVA